MSKEATAKAFTKLALEKTGRIDVLVNNAGVQIVHAIHEQTEGEWDLRGEGTVIEPGGVEGGTAVSGRFSLRAGTPNP